MDETYLATFLQRSSEERNRTQPPAGFPALPDLPLGRYTDQAFFQLELDSVWRGSWLYATHDSMVQQPGDYVLTEIAGTSVIVVRQADSTVRAFVNACRHRGAPVVRDARGNARLFSCPYHSWTYDLGGNLVRVPEERDFVGLCREARHLVPVQIEAWGGWWFVNLDNDASSLVDWLGPVAGNLQSLADAKWQPLKHSTVHLNCNWKVLAEGFLEVYHARTVHPKTIAPTLDTAGTVISLYPNGHQSMVSPVIPGSRTDNRDQLPKFPGTPPMLAAGHNPAHGLFPNLITPLDPRGFPFLTFWPEAVDRTRLDIDWFAPSWGEGDVPGREHWDKRLDRFDAIMEEDYANLEPIQTSMTRAAHGGQVINYQERRIWHVHAQVDKMIGTDKIPEHLRVADLLADWIEI